MKSKGKKKVVINKEENSEDWCFYCKDGGEIRICDYKQCLKSYHPGCVDKDETFLTSEKSWACARHKCSLCERSSYFQCYTCPEAFCRQCLLNSANFLFLQVKGQNGFCNLCLQLALLIEENKNCDSDGRKVDFTDRETMEGLFAEYYKIIKTGEGFELEDIYAAKNRLKVKTNHQFGEELYDEEEEEEEDEEEVSDYDDVEHNKKPKRIRKEKKSDRQKNAVQTPLRSNKKEFIGWASRSLGEFLDSIGESTNDKLSQRQVASIIDVYVKENKLSYQGKTKKIIECDERLRSLFGKDKIGKNRVYDLLEVHFAENNNESEEEEDLGYDSEEDDIKGITSSCKKQRKIDMEEKSNIVDQSSFASIVVENIKLVYLKRSLLQEMLKYPENFEEKVMGCFVRVKSDPYNYLSRNSHQLMQVKGVKKVSTGENNTETALLFSDIPKEVKTSLLSDDDFSEEECEELRQKLLAGLFERPTVGNLQQKANILHEDLTKHWIAKQLKLLPNLIDLANEKGWRRELFEYLEMKKKLQTPEEVSRLLKNLPRITPDPSQLDSNPGDIINNMKNDERSPKSILAYNSSVPGDVWQNNMTLEERAHDGHSSSPLESKLSNSDKSTPELKHDTSEKKMNKLEEAQGSILCSSLSSPGNKLSLSDKSTPQLKHDTVNSEENTNKLEAAKESILCSREVIELLSDDENGCDSKDSSVLENGRMSGKRNMVH